MRKLLSLLTVLTLTVPVPLNVIACGNSKTPPDSNNEPVDTITLVKKASDDIDLGFAQLIKENKNLTSLANFTDGTKLLEEINNSSKGSKITSDIVKNDFFNFTANNITNTIIPYLLNDKEISPLFQAIPINNILKLSINDSSITKVGFAWKAADGVDFGIVGYNENSFKITDWFKLSLNLKLVLNYNDNGIVNEKDLDKNFDYHFTNDGAQISQIVDLSTNEIIKKFNNYILNIDLGDNKDTLSWREEDVFLNLASTSIEKKISDKKVVVTKGNLQKYDDLQQNPGPSDSSGGCDFGLNYLRGNGDSFNIEQFKTNMIQGLATVESTWETKFSSWQQGKSVIQDLDNVFIYGTYTLSNWNYQNLDLKPLDLPFVVKRNITRSEEAENAAEITAKLWCKNGGLLNDKYDMGGKDFGWKMNPEDYDKYINDGKTFFDSLKYGAEKIKSLGKEKGILNDNDQIEFYSSNFRDATQNWILKDYQKGTNKCNKNFHFNNNEGGQLYFSINGYFLSLSRYSGRLKQSFSYQWVYKSDKDIWPTS